MLGEAVGLHLLESGYSLTVYNRTISKTASLKEKGAAVVDQPKLVAESSDLVITCVKDADAVNHVLFGRDGLVAGKQADIAVADMSTINPSAAKEFSKILHGDGIRPWLGSESSSLSGQAHGHVSDSLGPVHDFRSSQGASVRSRTQR